MKKSFLSVFVGTVAILATVSCTSMSYNNQQQSADSGIKKADIGTVLGAIVGGVGGSQIGKGSGQLWATGAGVFLGAIVGRGIGQSLDRADEMHAQAAYEYTLETLPSGYTGGWENPDNGHSGTYTPTRTWEQAPGQYCREFQQTVTIGGHTEQAYGTACRQPDGSWKISQNDTSQSFNKIPGDISYRYRASSHNTGGRCLDGDNLCYRIHGYPKD